MMKTRVFRSSSVSMLLLSLFLCSCASGGRKFNYSEVHSVSLGRLTPAEAQQKFGNPRLTATKVTKDGTFEIFRYAHAKAGFMSVRARGLALEFRNGQLNAYAYGSSFDQDKTITDVAAVDKIQIGSATRTEVSQLLGEPGGKARCPSILADFKEMCENGTEVWVWAAWDEINVGSRRAPVKLSTVAIAFDAEGKVSDRQTANVATQ